MPHLLPPLNALRAFEAAGRTLTFRAAAEELNVTQGAVAQQVRGLEDRLGVRLFERHPKGLAFTDTGRSYHEQVSRAFALLREATEALHRAPTRVTVSVTPTFASKWLIPNLPSLTGEHPEIDLRIVATEAVSSFQADAIDLAVRQGKPPFGASLQATRLFRQDIIAVCAPALLSGAAAPLAAEAPPGLTLLHDSHNLWPEFLETVPGAGPGFAGKGLRFNQTSLSIEAALAGQGIALVSRFLVERDLAEDRLVQAFPGVLRGNRDFYLLTPRASLSRQAVADVAAWLTAQGESDPV